MAKTKRITTTWKFRNRRSDYWCEGGIVAYWEASLDAISDGYTPKEIAARELFQQWAKQVEEKYPNSLVPVYWFVECKEHGIFEAMPFQFGHFAEQTREDFLAFFTWPVDSVTSERLNWVTLPVADKLWNPKHADKGGFIQQATGWKPSILQPYVYLPALTSVLREY